MHARDRLIHALGVAMALLAPAPALADEPWLLSLEGSAAIPLAAPQSEWFGPGGSLAVTLLRSVASPLAVGVRTRAGLLADGPAPSDATLADPGMGSFFGLSLGARLRLEALWDSSPRRGTGPWVEAFGGAALTGPVMRPALEVGLGWGIELGDIDLAPVARWTTIFEVDSQLAPSSAHLLLLGVEVTFLDARPAPPPPPTHEPASDDLCPLEEEDADGFQDGDGCPDPDNDADGVADSLDACPNVPEDRDGLADEDGCPERDADADGIADNADACPSQPEVVNGIEDTDGCPDEGLIALVNDRIVLDERVLFELNQARVRHRALPVLDAIVELCRQHPEWAELLVEGHADSQGDRSFNQRLSEHRAREVRSRLVERGIRADIITSAGFGETRPRATGQDEESFRINRRVEFVVVRRAGAPHTQEGEAR